MKNYNIVIFGLDNAGKTTLSLRLDKDKSFPSLGKWGFSTKKVVIKIKKYLQLCIPIPYFHKVGLTLFDLGGHVKIRKIWPSYYRDVYACIFVIDANDPLRFLEAKEALYTVAKDPMMEGKPFLVVSNVKSKKTAVPLEELKAFLDISSISSISTMQDNRLFIIESEMNSSTATLFQGTERLIKAVELHESSIAARIAIDTKSKLGQSTYPKSKKVHPELEERTEDSLKMANAAPILKTAAVI